MDRICFHLDENVSNAIATALRRMEIEVSTTPEAKLLGQSDEAQLEFAQTEGRVIVTHDDDFLKSPALKSIILVLPIAEKMPSPLAIL